MKTNVGRLALAAGLLLLGWFGREVVGFREKPRGERAQEAVAVTSFVVTNAAFNPPSEYVGHVESAQSADILPQVDGYIKRVCFAEGAMVSEGDLLFEIDDEQYVAARNLRHSEVASAEAKVVVARAEVDRAERYFRRIAAADERGVPATECDAAETALASAKAALNAANAAVGQAKAAAAIADFNLRHTKVFSPMRGRIGKALRHVGDYVSPAKSALARVVQTDPVRVVFPVCDRYCGEWIGGCGTDTRRLRVVLPDGSTYGHEGTVEFGNNEIDRATGTLAIHVAFPNPDGMLLANEFVRVVVDSRSPRAALVVPTASLVRTDDGLQAWKIGDDGRAHPVSVATDGEWDGLSRVRSGLSDGDVVVESGAFKLKDGDMVKVICR